MTDVCICTSSTVVSEKNYGQSSDVGVSTNYAREDHTHGTPNLYSPGPLTNQTSNRALDTVYTNNTGRPILLMVIAGCNGHANPGPLAAFYAAADSNNPPTTVVAGGVGLQYGTTSVDEVFWFQLIAFIDVGLNYSVNTLTSDGGTVTLSTTGWYELQL